MSIHLPNHQSVEFDDQDDLEQLLNDENERQITLTAFFKLNEHRQREGAIGDLFYTDVLKDNVWKKERGMAFWKPRQRDKGTIARMYYVNPNAGDLFYLRYLLLNVPNSTSFEDLRTVNGSLLPGYHAACTARGLLHDDAEWDEALGEADPWQGGGCLRGLFVTILLNCDPNNPLDLWNKHKTRYVGFLVGWQKCSKLREEKITALNI